MKNATLLGVLSLSLLLFVSACSGEGDSIDKNHGSSITTETPGMVPSLNSGNDTNAQAKGEEDGTTDQVSKPNLQISNQNLQVDPLFEPYLQDLNLLLDGFDTLSVQIEETFEKYLEYPDSSKSFSDYNTALGRLVAHLRSVEDLTAPENLRGLHEDFVMASHSLGDGYEKVAELMKDGFSAETQEELEEFEELTGEIVAVTEDFVSTAFALMVEMEQPDLAG